VKSFEKEKGGPMELSFPFLSVLSALSIF